MKISACQGRDTKIYYKDYKNLHVKTMARLFELSRTCSLSSYHYGEGVTSSGEECQGHRAGDSITGAGDVLFFDFDDTGLTFSQLSEALDGLSAFAGPSKSWTEDCLKFHAAVQIDRDLPLDANEFKKWYRAVVQWLGLEKYYDPAMVTQVQQLAPHWMKDGPSFINEGTALDMDAVLAAYIEPEIEAGKSGDGLAGVVDEAAIFTLSTDGTKLTVADMRERVTTQGKQRVHCIAGLEHDGRRDTAFVSENDGTVYYHCSGGRCGQTLILAADPGFVPELDGGGSESALPETLHDWIDKARELISHHPVYNYAVQMGAKPEEKETAVVWVANHILKQVGVRRIEGSLHLFDGKVWQPFLREENGVARFATAVCRAAGFPWLADSPARLPRIAKLVLRDVRELERRSEFDALNLQNGVYVMGKGLCKHDPRFVFTSVLPYSYDASATCPTWETVVSRVMLGSPEMVEALQDAIGYLLLPKFNLEKMICFVGEGSNGKTTVNKVVRMLVGANNYSSQRLHMLTKEGGEGAYARAAMVGKLINITEELSPKAMESTLFKEIVSGDEVDARWPYGRPFTLARCPKQLASTNTTDRLVQERTEGFQRRLHLIPFNYRIVDADKDTQIANKLAVELPGILNWVLAGAARVMKQQRLGTAPEMTHLFEKVVRDSSTTQQYFEERLDQIPVPDKREDWPKTVCHIGPIYEDYVRYCQDNGYHPVGRNKFSRELERLGAVKINKSLTVRNKSLKASGFWLRLLKPHEWREPGERQNTSNLRLVPK